MSRRTERVQCRRARAGFTLLEAAIAVVIIGMAAAAVLSSFGTTLRTSARARRALEAEALGGQRLAYVELLSNAELSHLPDSASHGRFPAPFEEYGWEATSNAVRGDDGLFDVRVEVTWSDGRYALPTRLYRSAPMPDALP